MVDFILFIENNRLHYTIQYVTIHILTVVFFLFPTCFAEIDDHYTHTNSTEDKNGNEHIFILGVH